MKVFPDAGPARSARNRRQVELGRALWQAAGAPGGSLGRSMFSSLAHFLIPLADGGDPGLPNPGLFQNLRRVCGEQFADGISETKEDV